MDERLLAFAWILGSGCFGAVLGGVFGALAGALYWRSGRASGTRLGLRLAETFGRFAGREPSPTTKGGLVGAVDGFLFLGTVGTVLGAAAVYVGRTSNDLVRPALWLALLLVGGAAFFGVLAYTLTRAGVRALAGVCICGIVGAALGSYVAGLGGLLCGCLVGVVIGNAIGLWWPSRYEPKFESYMLPLTPEERRAEGDGIQGVSGIEKGPK